MIKTIVDFIRDLYKTNEFVPLHAPQFSGNEKQYVLDTLDSTFVSSVGKYVDQFEKQIESFTGTSKAVATVNGTAALHTALHMAGVSFGDLVITQALTFVATCNALHHMGAEPIFVDVSRRSLGLCPKALGIYLEENTFIDAAGECRLSVDNRRVKAVIPMHTFGHPVELDELVQVCEKWHLVLIEDAAESLGSFYKNRHTGTVGDYGALSFNGNKIITTGGGGMVLCKSESNGMRTKHITTTAKIPHPFEYMHDEAGFNYRLPNLNSALGCAQMEVLPAYVESKRRLAGQYKEFFNQSEYEFVVEPHYAKSNYWLNALVCENTIARDRLLKETNNQGVMTRPVWKLMHRLPMYKDCLSGDLPVSEVLESCLVNLPSTPRIENSK